MNFKNPWAKGGEYYPDWLGGENTLGGNKINGIQLGAWKVTNHWNEKTIQKFRDNVESISRRFILERRKFTCEDFVLYVLIEFSESEGLPLSFLDKNLAGFWVVYNQEEFSSKSEFSQKVFDNMGAKNISYNTVRKTFGFPELEGFNGFDNAEAGNIVLLGYKEDHISHAQLVYQKIKSDYTRIYVYQGNYRDTQPTLIENGFWNYELKLWYNMSEKNSSELNVFKKLDLYDWNFQAFNERSKSAKGRGY
jgi:hypothetical protein